MLMLTCLVSSNSCKTLNTVQLQRLWTEVWSVNTKPAYVFYSSLSGVSRFLNNFKVYGPITSKSIALFIFSSITLFVIRKTQHTVYSTKLAKDLTFAVRSPCEYLWKLSSLHQNNVHKCQNTLKFATKHLQFKQTCLKLLSCCQM